MDNQTRRILLERVKASGFPGSILDVFQNPAILDQFIAEQQQSQLQQPQNIQVVAETPEQQRQGLRPYHNNNITNVEMAFPNVEANQSINTIGMKGNLDVKEFDKQGNLVKSFKAIPPGIANFPTGANEGSTLIESPAEGYQKGGFNKYQTGEFREKIYTDLEEFEKANKAHEDSLALSVMFPLPPERYRIFPYVYRNEADYVIGKDSKGNDIVETRKNKRPPIEPIGFTEHSSNRSGKVFNKTTGKYEEFSNTHRPIYQRPSVKPIYKNLSINSNAPTSLGNMTSMVKSSPLNYKYQLQPGVYGNQIRVGVYQDGKYQPFSREKIQNEIEENRIPDQREENYKKIQKLKGNKTGGVRKYQTGSFDVERTMADMQYPGYTPPIRNPLSEADLRKGYTWSPEFGVMAPEVEIIAERPYDLVNVPGGHGSMVTAKRYKDGTIKYNPETMAAMNASNEISWSNNEDKITKAFAIAASLPAFGRLLGKEILGTGINAGNILNPLFIGHGIYNTVNPNSDFRQAVTKYNQGEGDWRDVAFEGGLNALNFLGVRALPRDIKAIGRGSMDAYNNVATGNSFLTDLGVRPWKIERPANNSIYSGLSRPYISRSHTDRETELLNKFGKGMNLTPQEWDELTTLTRSGATDFSKTKTPISRILGYYNTGSNEEKAIEALKIGDVFNTPTEKSIRTWSAGIPETMDYLKGKTRLVVPSRYTKNLGSNFSAMPYDDLRVNFIHADPKTGMRPFLNFNATRENELMGNIPEGWKVIGKSSEDGMNNLIIKPINPKQLPGSKTSYSIARDPEGKIQFLDNDAYRNALIAGKQNVIQYLSDPRYRAVVEQNQQLANRVGLNRVLPIQNELKQPSLYEARLAKIQEPLDLNDPRALELEIINNNSNVSAQYTRTLGGKGSLTIPRLYSPEKITGSTEHEVLHHIYPNLGEGYPSFTPLEARKVKSVFKSSEELRKIEEANDVPYLYLDDVDELVPNSFDLARDLGIAKFQKYPGVENFKKMLESYTGGKKFIKDALKLDTPRDYKRAWDMLSGVRVAIIPAALTIAALKTQKTGGVRKYQTGSFDVNCQDENCRETDQIQAIYNNAQRIPERVADFELGVVENLWLNPVTKKEKKYLVEGRKGDDARDIWKQYGINNFVSPSCMYTAGLGWRCAPETKDYMLNFNPTNFNSNTGFINAVNKGTLPFNRVIESNQSDFDLQKAGNLRPGDIVNFKGPDISHAMTFTGYDEKGNSKWFHSPGPPSIVTDTNLWKDLKSPKVKKYVNRFDVDRYVQETYGNKIQELEKQARENPTYYLKGGLKNRVLYNKARYKR